MVPRSCEPLGIRKAADVAELQSDDDARMKPRRSVMSHWTIGRLEYAPHPVFERPHLRSRLSTCSSSTRGEGRWRALEVPAQQRPPLHAEEIGHLITPQAYLASVAWIRFLSLRCRTRPSASADRAVRSSPGGIHTCRSRCAAAVEPARRAVGLVDLPIISFAFRACTSFGRHPAASISSRSSTSSPRLDRHRDPPPAAKGLQRAPLMLNPLLQAAVRLHHAT